MCMTKDFTIDDIWQAQRLIYLYMYYFHPVKHNQDFQYSALMLIFLLQLLLSSHFEHVKLLTRENYIKGTVKLTNTMLGVRDRLGVSRKFGV